MQGNVTFSALLRAVAKEKPVVLNPAVPLVTNGVNAATAEFRPVSENCFQAVGLLANSDCSLGELSRRDCVPARDVRLRLP